MGLGKPEVLADVEVASFSRAKILKLNPQILGSFAAYGHAHFLFWLRFYDGP